jgi:glucokinase
LRERPGAYLAIDIGGTKVAAAVVDAEGSVSARRAIPTPRDTSAHDLFEAIVGLANSVRTAAAREVSACGVGCGGPMDDSTVSPLNIPAWRRFPLRASLSDALGLEVDVDNDAKAIALAEGWLGAARSRRNYLAMVVSTGIGGGVVLDGRLLDGRLGNAGHVGHVNVEPAGRTCPCGATGCLEAEASGTAIEAATGQPASEAGLDVRIRAGTHVGRAVATVANLLDLDLAVVGGSVALGFGSPFFDAARAELEMRARLDFSTSCRIVPVGLGDEAPLVGAAAIAMRGAGAPWIRP